MKCEIAEKIIVPDDVEVKIDKSIVAVHCKGAKIEKRFAYPNIKITNEGNFIVIMTEKGTKREKRMINTFKANIGNMIRGIKNDYTYRLMACSSHFPMNISIENKDIIIKNFLGEKVPRKAKIIDGVNVSLNGNVISVSGPDKELVGQMAGKIEILTKIKGRDKRIFQDGCYIFDKAGKLIK